MNCDFCGEDMFVEEEYCESGTLLRRTWVCEGCKNFCDAIHQISPEPTDVYWKKTKEEKVKE